MSDQERRKKAREVFLAIADLPEGEQTRALETSCAGDPALQREVKALLDADDAGFLAHPAVEVAGVTEDATVRLDPAVYSFDAWVERLSASAGKGARYESSEALRRGGMAEVRRVYEPALRRHLAMKVLPDSARDAASLGRFLEEAQVTAQLDHPGIVPVHELGVNNEHRLFFTMKLVKGRDLREILGQRGEPGDEWSRPRVLSVLLRCCEALAYAHKKGVIHRDLKPANIMVGRYGETYVMDWGLARVRDEPERGPPDHGDGLDSFRPVTSARQSQAESTGTDLETEDGTVIGTPAYMAPEQAAGKGHDVGPTADVYAMGAILYHVLTGHPPYLKAGVKVPAHTVLSWVLDGPPTPLKDAARDGEAELISICERAMARQPADRYPDMEALATDLRAFLEGRVVRAHAVGAGAELRKWVQRNQKTAWVTLGSVLTVASLATFSYLRIRDEAEVSRHALAETRRAHQRTQAAFDMLKVDELGRRIDLELWPVHASGIPRMEAWLDEAAALDARAALYREELGRADTTSTHEYREHVAGATAAIARLLGDTAGEPNQGRVHKRLQSARSAATVGSDHRAAWDAARARIADATAAPWYRGLPLAVQEGLVPIGRDPGSGLEEFWHVTSGSCPERDRSGMIRPRAEFGAVLVLIPGGTFLMGAQAFDEDAGNFDPDADVTEGPVRDVTLAPFFASKWELTQPQWRRISGSSPSARAGGEDDTYPVEQVSFDDCVVWLDRFGLALPTEAQWERLARANTDTPWFCGSDPASCAGAGNLADLNAYRTARQASWQYELSVEDEFLWSAPIGSFEPNPFGLHDTVGNVFEWCLDVFVSDAYRRTPRPGDGLCPPQANDGRDRVVRGGSYSGRAFEARSAFRLVLPPSAQTPIVGVRAVRAVEHPSE